MTHTTKLQFLTLIGLLYLINDPAFAHGTERGLVMLLPTDYYQLGGAIAVAVSFLLLIFVPNDNLERWKISSLPLGQFPRISPYWSSSVAFVFLVFLTIAGITGDTDPYANPMPLFIWTIWWVGFTVLQFFTGNLWPYLNPWSGPVHLFRKMTGIKEIPLALPNAVGYWPAVLLFAGFAWFELISLSPDDPLKLTQLVIFCWTFSFIGMVLFGEEKWCQQAEPFSIFFRLVGSFSPFQYIKNEVGDRTKIVFVWPGSGLLALPPLPFSGVLFVLLTLSSVSFDGFSKTFTWASWIGVNPLEFPGRSAVTLINSMGYFGGFLLLTIAFYTSVYLGCLLVKRPQLFRAACGRLIYAIIPISLAFHLAHYLMVLLINGQYAALAFNDPFALDWNLLGFQGYNVTTSFLTNLERVETLWITQTIVIVFGHVISVFLAHLMACEIYGSTRAAMSQGGLVLLMIFYTVFGLWLLSTPAMG